MVFSHPQVFYPEVRQIICQTPCNSVDVILHGQRRGNSMFSEFFDRLKESLERVFVYNLRHIEIQEATSICPSAMYFFSLFTCSSGLFFKLLVYSPCRFAGPSELRIICVVFCLFAVFNGIIYIPEMFRQDFGLRFGVAYICVSMLNEIYRPFLDRSCLFIDFADRFFLVLSV